VIRKPRAQRTLALPAVPALSPLVAMDRAVASRPARSTFSFIGSLR
jgi:hypothetical protein